MALSKEATRAYIAVIDEIEALSPSDRITVFDTLHSEQKVFLKRMRRIETLKVRFAPPRSVAKNVEEVAKKFQKLIRLRYADSHGMCKCFTCEERIKWNSAKSIGEKGMDAGHFHGRNNKSVIFDTRNCFPQCVHCNRNLSGNKDVYRKLLIEHLGQVQFDQLETRKNEAKVWKPHELALMCVDFEEEIKLETKRIEAGKCSKWEITRGD